MALLTRIEDIISIPMELFHKQKGFHPVDLNRMAMRCMERGCRKGIKQVYAPNRFEVVLNPADHDDLRPFLSIIRSDITGELRRVIEERNYLLAGDLSQHRFVPLGLSREDQLEGLGKTSTGEAVPRRRNIPEGAAELLNIAGHGLSR